MNSTTDFYLDDAFLRKASVEKESWSLDGTDEYFECMKYDTFLILESSAFKASRPIVTYEEVKPPNGGAPSNAFELEYCAHDIVSWFSKLNEVKTSISGHGCIWPLKPNTWCPREIKKYEDL